MKFGKSKKQQELLIRQTLLQTSSVKSLPDSNIQMRKLQKKISLNAMRISRISRLVETQQKQAGIVQKDGEDKKTQLQFESNVEELNSPNKRLYSTNEFVFNSYDIWDLTYTLTLISVQHLLLFFIYLVLVLIRYYTFACLIYVAVDSHGEQWKWVFTILISNFFYFICILKISLKNGETQSEIILKSSFNSLQDEVHEYFQYTNKKKFIISVLRAMVPPEFSFFYIKGQTKRRRVQIYEMINYIYTSIECVIYYPFFIIYCLIITEDNTFALNKDYKNATVYLAAFAMLVFVSFSAYLLVVGCKRKGLFKQNYKQRSSKSNN